MNDKGTATSRHLVVLYPIVLCRTLGREQQRMVKLWEGRVGYVKVQNEMVMLW